MVKRPTIADLAAAAGVSVATVDRVLNRRLPVTSDTAQRVVTAAEAIGYHATGLLKRRISEIPSRKFGFLLQKRDNFYQAFGRDLVAATKSNRDVDGKALLEFMDELLPAVIVQRLNDMAPKVDALAVVAMDHPQVNQAVEALVAGGKPVFTLLSPISSTAVTGHFGLDSRKCGKIAGWTISRLARKPGKIGILVGSHRYINQETSEISFRTFMREHAPQFQLLEPIINLDDERIAYEAVTDMAASYDDLVAVYVSGGGQDGLIRALREISGRPRPIAVCNELTDTTRAALLDGTIDLALGTPIASLSIRLVEVMAKACAASHPPHFPAHMAAPEIFISENL
ncbi:MAG: LacI family DNA-binding transcriptional regulator [Hyphomicrobiales bacterium]